MSEGNKLTVQLKGALSDDEHLRLSDFIEQLNAVKDVLLEIDRGISRSQVPATDYRIVDLSHSSPARVVIEAIPNDPVRDDHSMAVVDKFFRGLQLLSGGQAPEDFDSALLEAFGRIGKGFRKNISEITFIRGNEQVEVGRTFQAEIIRIIGDDELSEGSIVGMLELINLHGGVNKFHIYPAVGPKKVSCHFPSALLQDAIESINRHVNVLGKLRYKKRDRFAYGINVSSIEIYPQDEELPTIFDIRGIAPSATGSMTSEQFVRKLRNAE